MKYQFDSKQHLHLLDNEPLTGTSSIGDVLAKNLTWWAAELAAVECLESGEKIATIRYEYEEAVKSGNKKVAIDALQVKYPIFKKARFAHMKKRDKAADEGTDLHAELEKYVKACIGTAQDRLDIFPKLDPKIQPFIDWADKNVKRFLASEAHCFDEELWVGGIVDCVAELKDDQKVIIDFKSAKEAYPNHFIQTAGYAIQIAKNGLFTADGEKISDPLVANALVVVPFGAKIIEPVARVDINNCKDAFKFAVGLYRFLGLTK